MPRTKGAKNANYAERRAELASRALPAFLGTGGRPASFRALAREIGVDASTLRHYFGDYDGLFQAAFERLEVGSQPFRDQAARLVELPPEEGLVRFLHMFLEGWHDGVDHLFHIALVGGVENTARGQAVVMHLLDPMLVGFDTVLRGYRERQVLDIPHLRSASMMLLSPLVLLLLHQESLGGAAAHPIDVDKEIERWVGAFLRAYQPR